MKAKASGRYACPLSRKVVLACEACEGFGPHLREELVAKGQEIPVCEKHKVPLEGE